MRGVLRRRRHAEVQRARARQEVADSARQLALAIDSVPTESDPTSIELWWSIVDESQGRLAAAIKVAAVTVIDPAATATVRQIHAVAEETRQAVAADRALRIGPPQPTREQLAYSLAALRDCSARLRNRAAALTPLPDAAAPGDR